MTLPGVLPTALSRGTLGTHPLRVSCSRLGNREIFWRVAASRCESLKASLHKAETNLKSHQTSLAIG